MHVLTFKKYFLLFVVGLLACAGSREIEHRDIATGSFCGSGAALGSERGGLIIAPAKIGNGGFISTTPNTPYRMSAKDSTLLAALLSAPAPDKIADDITTGSFGDTSMMYSGPKGTPLIFNDVDNSVVDGKAQQFDVRVTIAFPRMTLQQAAELEARVRKLFPEAQEIDFGLEKKIEAPAESFYYEIPDSVEFRTLPGYFSAPAYNYNVLKRDSTGKVIWREF